MIYSDIAIAAFAISVLIDLFLFKNSMLTRAAFWTSYAIILPFQLLTNWWLTSRNIVMYNPDAIIGFRICAAPLEDLLFGFALVLSVMGMWEFWGRHECNVTNYFSSPLTMCCSNCCIHDFALMNIQSSSEGCIIFHRFLPALIRKCK